MYSSAKINMSISRAAMVGTILGLLPIVLKVAVGPFHPFVVIIIFYLYRFIFIFIMNMLTFKTFLASAFIVDFERMSGRTRFQLV